jgi:GntR family transcriptional regulator, transcriptional repressor for pyruvate dehydrogenase complex
MEDKNEWFKAELGRGSVSRLILEKIEDAIINKTLNPGDFLPTEVELAKGLGVGKGSVREAVKMLEGMGIVEIKRGQGTIIKDSSDNNNLNALVFQLLLHRGNINDIIELRDMFETAFSVIAMHKATDDDRAKIKQTIIELEQKIASGIYEEKYDIAFHMAILKATHNYYVIRVGETIYELFKASIRKSVSKTPEWVLDDHKKIFTYFCSKNERKLREAIASSIERWRYNI